MRSLWHLIILRLDIWRISVKLRECKLTCNRVVDGPDLFYNSCTLHLRTNTKLFLLESPTTCSMGSMCTTSLTIMGALVHLALHSNGFDLSGDHPSRMRLESARKVAERLVMALVHAR